MALLDDIRFESEIVYTLKICQNKYTYILQCHFTLIKVSTLVSTQHKFSSEKALNEQIIGGKTGVKRIVVCCTHWQILRYSFKKRRKNMFVTKHNISKKLNGKYEDNDPIWEGERKAMSLIDKSINNKSLQHWPNFGNIKYW